MKQTKGPQFIRFFKPVIEVLKETGGSGTAAEVIDRVMEKTRISEKEQEVTNKNGQSRVKNQVNWARVSSHQNALIDSPPTPSPPRRLFVSLCSLQQSVIGR